MCLLINRFLSMSLLTGALLCSSEVFAQSQSACPNDSENRQSPELTINYS